MGSVQWYTMVSQYSRTPFFIPCELDVLVGQVDGIAGRHICPAQIVSKQTAWDERWTPLWWQTPVAQWDMGGHPTFKGPISTHKAPQTGNLSTSCSWKCHFCPGNGPKMSLPSSPGNHESSPPVRRFGRTRCYNQSMEHLSWAEIPPKLRIAQWLGGKLRKKGRTHFLRPKFLLMLGMGGMEWLLLPSTIPPFPKHQWEFWWKSLELRKTRHRHRMSTSYTCNAR